MCSQDNFDDVYKQAVQAQSSLERMVADEWQNIPKDSNEPPHKEPVPTCAKKWVEKAISPGIKTRKSAKDKMDIRLPERQKGHAKYLKDLARITLEYTDCTRMAGAIKDSGLKIIFLKNRIAYPTVEGYSDIKTEVEIQLGDTYHIVEVQLNHPLMISAKERGHHYYDKIREMVPELCSPHSLDKETFKELCCGVLSELERTSFDFATEELKAKTSSPLDVLNITGRIRDEAIKCGEAGGELEVGVHSRTADLAMVLKRVADVLLVDLASRSLMTCKSCRLRQTWLQSWRPSGRDSRQRTPRGSSKKRTRGCT